MHTRLTRSSSLPPTATAAGALLPAALLPAALLPAALFTLGSTGLLPAALGGLLAGLLPELLPSCTELSPELMASSRGWPENGSSVYFK